MYSWDGGEKEKKIKIVERLNSEITSQLDKAGELRHCYQGDSS